MGTMADALTSFLLSSRLLFFVLLFVSLVLSLKLGHVLGGWRRAALGDRADEGASLIVGSILGLLAFVLALNLSNANSRFDWRLEAALDEVNAIGTATMQAEAVGGPEGQAIGAAMKTYLLLRYRYVSAGRASPEIARTTAETAELQGRIWADLTRLLDRDKSPASVSLMNALNNAFDASTVMRRAMEYRMPSQMVLLLLAMSVLGTAAVGYQFGLTNRRGLAPGWVLSLLWCVVVIQIFDIGAARVWSFRTDTRVYEWSLEGADLPANLQGQ